jgi:hypothetical protein
MKHLLFSALVLVTLAVTDMGCSSSKHTTTQPGSQQATPGFVQDGSSYASAIVIQEKGETAGVAAEYKWIRDHYPGSTNKMQALQNKNGKAYDVLTIVTADGVQKQVYFDISNFFGKF